MRLNVKAVDEKGDTEYYSYDFEGYQRLFMSTDRFDKTNKMIYEGDTVEYKNNLYNVDLGEFETKDGLKCIGWYLRSNDPQISCVPINEDTLKKIKVIDE